MRGRTLGSSCRRPDMVTHVFKMKVNEFTVDARKELPLVNHFTQVLPVVESGSRAEILDSSLTRSPLWHHVIVLRLRDGRTNLDIFAQWFSRCEIGQ